MPDPLPPLHQTHKEKQIGHSASPSNDSLDSMELPICCPTILMGMLSITPLVLFGLFALHYIA
jgi:hypothetical protein